MRNFLIERREMVALLHHLEKTLAYHDTKINAIASTNPTIPYVVPGALTDDALTIDTASNQHMPRDSAIDDAFVRLCYAYHPHIHTIGKRDRRRIRSNIWHDIATATNIPRLARLGHCRPYPTRFVIRDLSPP